MCVFFCNRILCTGFRIFKLSESFWNRFKWILLDQEYALEKNHRKILNFSCRKIKFSKKRFWKKFEKSKNLRYFSKCKKSQNFSKGNFDFSKGILKFPLKKNNFFPHKNNIFSKSFFRNFIFRHEKINIFWWVFFLKHTPDSGESI